MLQVKTSTIPNAGKGLFATVDIPKRTKLGEYKGKRLSEQQFQRTTDTSYVWKVSARGKNVYVAGMELIIDYGDEYILRWLLQVLHAKKKKKKEKIM